MTKLLIIADDLTGSVDTGVQFAKAGIASYVSLTAECDMRGLFGKFEVVVINSESRHCEPTLAASRVCAIARAGQKAGATAFYKKTDSTLRGNLGSELDALRKTAGQGRLAFVPALPQLGRTTVGGFHFVHGEPLHKTAFAADPLNPINDNFVPHVLGRQTSVPITVITRSMLNQEQAPVLNMEGIYVFDAETENDLREVANFLEQSQLLNVAAGPAGLAAFLPDLLDFERRTVAVKIPSVPMLIVNGSINPVSLRQIERAKASGLNAFRLSPEMLFQPKAARALCDGVAEFVGQAPTNGDLLVWSARKPAEVQEFIETGKASGLSGPKLHLHIAKHLARVVRQILEFRQFGLLVIFGGDTFAAIARELRWAGFFPRNELLPGVTHSQSDTGIHILSKAGGFGDEDLIDQIMQRLQNQ